MFRIDVLLSKLTAVSYLGPVANGRTKPIRIESVDDADNYIETVTKFSARCDRKATSLAVEAICAALATDLGLPIPESYIVQVDSDLINQIPEQEVKGVLLESDSLGFGSKQLPAGYFGWSKNNPVHQDTIADALGVFVFDCFVQNIDRKPLNPNCLTNGTKIGIFDHEIALYTKGVIGWQAPWETGGLEAFASDDKHIFFNSLHGHGNIPILIDTIAQRWQNLTEARIEAYGNTIPQSWLIDNEVQDMLTYLQELKSNLDRAIAEVTQVLA